MRLQLIGPHKDLVSPEVFNRMFTMRHDHDLFLYLMPLVFGFANYLVPLMISSRDMAFRASMPSVSWMSTLGGIFLYFQFSWRRWTLWSGEAPPTSVGSRMLR